MVPTPMPLEKRKLGTKLGCQKQEGAGPSCRALGTLTHSHSQWRHSCLHGGRGVVQSHTVASQAAGVLLGQWCQVPGGGPSLCSPLRAFVGSSDKLVRGAGAIQEIQVQFLGREDLLEKG